MWPIFFPQHFLVPVLYFIAIVTFASSLSPTLKVILLNVPDMQITSYSKITQYPAFHKYILVHVHTFTYKCVLML